MLNLFVLEGDPLQQGRIETIIKRSLSEHQLSYRSLNIFGKPQLLLDAIEETGNHQVFFLDIEIKGEEKKGLEIARAIRLQDPNAVIVFVTTHSEFMPITFRYRVAAMDFIDKGLSDDAFQEAIASILVHADRQLSTTVATDAFVFKNRHAHLQVPFSDILYFETAPTVHKVILTTKTGHTEFYGKVSEIAKQDDRLYQSHRAYVVNPDNVVKVDRKTQTVYFENEKSCLVSRLKMKGLVERVEKNRH